jgi:hypothetical protein
VEGAEFEVERAPVAVVSISPPLDRMHIAAENARFGPGAP